VHVLDRSVPCSAVLDCAVDGGVLWTASLRDVWWKPEQVFSRRFYRTKQIISEVPQYNC